MRTSAVKTVMLFLLSGAILGAVVASLIAPGLYAWAATPGETTQEIISRVSVIREATSMLMRAQAIGAGAGGLAGLVAGFLVSRALARRTTQRDAAKRQIAVG